MRLAKVILGSHKSPLARQFCGFYRIVNDKKIDVKEKRVHLYKSGRFEGYNHEHEEQIYDPKDNHAGLSDLVSATGMGAFGHSNTKFIVHLDLLPESRALEATFLTYSGKGKKIVHLDNVIPISFDDFIHGLTGIHLMPGPVIDREMVYKNTLEGENWLFDAQGSWDEKGIAHPELTIEKNWRELDFYRNIL